MPGLVLIVVGLILIVAPYPLVAVGARYRIWMGTLPQAAALRAARIAATVLVVVGLVVIAAT